MQALKRLFAKIPCLPVRELRFKRGDEVMYLGVRWTVRENFYVELMIQEMILQRINPFGKLETVSFGQADFPLVSPIHEEFMRGRA